MITYHVSQSVQFKALLFASSTRQLILCVNPFQAVYKTTPTHVQILLLELKCPMYHSLAELPLISGPNCSSVS